MAMFDAKGTTKVVQTCGNCYNCQRQQCYCSTTLQQIGHPLDKPVECRRWKFEDYLVGFRRQAQCRHTEVKA